jgi:hypothetical protein
MEILMAVDATTDRRANWKREIEKYVSLNEQLDQAQPADRDRLERAIVAQEEELLDTPAPTFAGVITKLELMWSAELHGLDAESEYKRLVLEDLGGLIADSRLLLGEPA